MGRSFILGAIVLMTATALGAGVRSAAAAESCASSEPAVCGQQANGARSTYANRCAADAAGAKVLHTEICFGQICPQFVRPICAADATTNVQKTFGNECFAENAGAVFVHDGACTP
jgi:hypothetical protein